MLIFLRGVKCPLQPKGDKKISDEVTLTKYGIHASDCKAGEMEFRGMVTFAMEDCEMGKDCPDIALNLVGYNVTTGETYGLDYGSFGSTAFGIPAIMFYNECVPDDLCYACESFVACFLCFGLDIIILTSCFLSS